MTTEEFHQRYFKLQNLTIIPDDLPLLLDSSLTQLSAERLWDFCRWGYSSVALEVFPQCPKTSRDRNQIRHTVSNIPLMSGAITLVSSEASRDCCHILSTKSSKSEKHLPSLKSSCLREWRWCFLCGLFNINSSKRFDDTGLLFFAAFVFLFSCTETSIHLWLRPVPSTQVLNHMV